jgi:hypothetical protein
MLTKVLGLLAKLKLKAAANIDNLLQSGFLDALLKILYTSDNEAQLVPAAKMVCVKLPVCALCPPPVRPLTALLCGAGG